MAVQEADPRGQPPTTDAPPRAGAGWPEGTTIVTQQQNGANVDGHLTAIGALMVAWGALVVLAGLFVLAATLFGGAVGESESGQEGVFAIAAGAGLLAFFILAVAGLPALIAGVGLLQRRPWARVFGIVVAAIALLNFPIGTVFGVYALVILTKPEAEAALQQQSVVVHG